MEFLQEMWSAWILKCTQNKKFIFSYINGFAQCFSTCSIAKYFGCAPKNCAQVIELQTNTIQREKNLATASMYSQIDKTTQATDWNEREIYWKRQ